MNRPSLLLCFLVPLLCTCDRAPKQAQATVINRTEYQDRLEGFWLAQCIANWTGLITEMDKIGNIGEVKTGDFYTRANWGGPDEPNIWSGTEISDISPVIDFVLLPPDTVWGADDDTDIEYMYQHLLYQHGPMLSPQQIRDGWVKHIRPEEENYLWVSNQRAFDMMQHDTLPPLTGDPRYNEHYAMIDAQLTTEIFGLFAPGRPDIALKMVKLPIQTSAREEAQEIAEFYVIMHALAGAQEQGKLDVQALADSARTHLRNDRYPALMYDYVKGRHAAGIPWEQCRDEVYQRYQVDEADGYDITSQDLYCNGCFAAGINFAASIVSLLYGDGDLKETIKIGALCGWDSDNPTATWAGLIGFGMGRKAVEATFGQPLSDKFWIHRTRQNFPNDGMDSFPAMAKRGLEIIDRVVTEEMGGEITESLWILK